MDRLKKIAPAKPAYRKLRGYAFDPSLSLKIDTATFNHILYKVPWEELRPTDEENKLIDEKKKQDKKEASDQVGALEGTESQTSEYKYTAQGIGPVGEYIEVIDYDPTVERFYQPVDLNDPYLLAQDGLEPSESNPQFHQQMVYAVIMTTIKNFEKALGRKVIWAPRYLANRKAYEEYVQRIRIYPHG